MKTITKKCQPPYFEQILNGTKRFEIRLNFIELKDILAIFYKDEKILSDPEVQFYSARMAGKTTEFIAKAKEHNIDLEHYAVGDTLELQEVEEHTICPQDFQGKHTPNYKKWFPSGRAVACRITSIVKIVISSPVLHENDTLNMANVEIDGHEWWTDKEIFKYGLVILGIEVITK